MTSSFSTMLLTALAIFDISCPADAILGRLEMISDELGTLLPSFHAAAFGATRPDRAVFVGSGPLGFAAREAALKVMELSAGQIPALWDTVLGFRHGPKSFVVPGTDIWIFPSSDPHTRAYDLDLAAELRLQFPQSVTTLVPVPQPFGDLWSVPLSVALAQVLAVVWSGALGLNIDDPFAGQGTLSRVVSGVKLYPVVAA
jgi:tagatose-6-phosphate ketose/aldose isomerase